MKSRNIQTILLSLLVMALWGSLFPFLKIGYTVFNIDASSVPDILMFAGMRFVVSGAIVSGFCLLRKEKLGNPKGKQILNIFLSGLFAIVLHYAFTYIGISTTDSSKTALIKQLGVLLYVCFAFLFFRDEKFSLLKILGGILGFAGIVAINYNPGGISFSTGDILIILASICSVVASIISKKCVAGNSPFWVTGISQLTGGLILLAAAVCLGGKGLAFTWRSVAVFSYICVSSIAAYTLWYYILKTSTLSWLFVVKFAEPLFACLFGAVLLGENIFKWQYLAAFVLISFGVILGNKSEKTEEKEYEKSASHG